MLPTVTLIAGTSVDWAKFVTKTNDFLDRSPTRELDNCGLAVGSPPTYLAALAEYHHRGTNPITAVREADRLLAHLSFTFLVTCDREVMMGVLKQTVGLIVLSAESTRSQENFIVTATLRDWKNAIVESCSAAGERDGRIFFNEVWKILVNIGFKDLFAAYQRREMRDQTFMLEKPKTRFVS